MNAAGNWLLANCAKRMYDIPLVGLYLPSMERDFPYTLISKPPIASSYFPYLE
jgi:hypothetical protein